MQSKITWKGWRHIVKPYNYSEAVAAINFEGNQMWGNLPLYLDEVNHSPTGFEWGYRGSGPAQLSYAILRSYFTFYEKMSNETASREAEKYYFKFKEYFVVGWRSEWEITSDEIKSWLREVRNYG